MYVVSWKVNWMDGGGNKSFDSIPEMDQFIQDNKASWESWSRWTAKIIYCGIAQELTPLV